VVEEATRTGKEVVVLPRRDRAVVSEVVRSTILPPRMGTRLVCRLSGERREVEAKQSEQSAASGGSKSHASETTWSNWKLCAVKQK
jgi:hypothetical protein